MQDFSHNLHKYDAQLKQGFKALRFNAELEKEFRSFFYARNVVKQRGAIIVGIILLLMLAPLDIRFLDADATQVYLFSRVWITIPVLVAALFFTFKPRLQKSFALFSFIIISFIGLTAVAVVIYTQYHQQYLPHEGIMLIIMVAFFLGGMHFKQSLSCALLICLVYFAMSEIILAPDPLRFHRYFLMFATGLIGGVAAYTLEYQQRVSFLQRGALKSLAKTDPLTGLYNRGAINQKLNHLVDYAYRENKTITLMLLDVDFFKPFNDHYGHIAGDKCLIQVANALSSHCKRPLDFAGRYGGEEFLIVWFDAKPTEVDQLASNVRNHIAAQKIPHNASKVAEILTFSAGIVSGTPAIPDAAQSLLQQADQCLYRAKDSGRNRILIQDLGDDHNLVSVIK